MADEAFDDVIMPLVPADGVTAHLYLYKHVQVFDHGQGAPGNAG
jgi:hypothetical protein